jgi:tRNA dimethylallyltransferase
VNGSVATPAGRHNERTLSEGLPVVVVLGPTATGKSALSLELAERFDGEVISSDSRYLYRGMDVGTAKPSGEELQRVPHHLVDTIDPEDDYSLAMFLDDAFDAIEATAARGHLPIVAGGTPLYLRALLQGWTVPRVPPDSDLRDELEALQADDLHQRLSEVDPVSAERIGPRNKRRLIRALEVYRGSGQPLSELEGKESPPYRFLLIGLYQEREALYRRIDERVRWMFANGLLDEARWLIERGVPDSSAAMSAIGYPEARRILAGELSMEEAIESTCFATHRYVRHQETWFRRFEDVVCLDSSDPSTRETAARLVVEFLSGLAGSDR